MKSFRSNCELSIAITVAGLLHLVALGNGTSEFRRCYNVSEYTHCFDVQYNTTNNQTLTMSFEDARQQCKNLQSTLIIIKDEETNEKLQEFMNEENNSIRSNDVWLDAYRFNDYNVTNRWQWLNKTLPNISASGVLYTADSNWYMAALEFNGNSFRLRAQQPHLGNSFACEYPVSTCPSVDSSNVRQFDGKCYTAVNESVSWYEARNRCLKGGGDLASFANVTSINFTSWLLSDPNVRYWIGLRFGGYIWKDSGEDVKFAKWILYGAFDPLCLAVCPTCNPSFSWYAKDCSITNNIHVVCHTATTLHPTTTSTIAASTALPSSGSKIPQSSNSSPQHESSESTSSKRLAIGIGVGVGVGIPVLIAVIVLVICIVVRSKTPVEKKTRNDKTELGAVQEPSAGYGNVSANDQYEQLNRNLDNTCGPMYDKLRAEVGAVREPSVGQVNESPNSPYEQLNRNQDSSSGPMYDELRAEVGAVREPPVGQVNESANSPYEQLNRNQDSSSGPMYDELRVAPEAQYEEFPPN